MSGSAEVEDAVRGSLEEFFQHIAASRWSGREREAVSLYSFGFLQRRFDPGRVLHDPAQIGIEVAVPGVDSVNRKRQVCKDLVLWAAPGMTCWDEHGNATRAPLAVLEWKVKRRGEVGTPSRRDVEWLTRFTSEWSESMGFAVTVVLGHRMQLDVVRVRGGEPKLRWVHLSAARAEDA